MGGDKAAAAEHAAGKGLEEHCRATLSLQARARGYATCTGLERATVGGALGQGRRSREGRRDKEEGGYARQRAAGRGRREQGKPPLDGYGGQARAAQHSTKHRMIHGTTHCAIR